MLPYAPWLCWLLPMIGALLTPLFGIVQPRLRDHLAVVSVGLCALFSFSMIPDVLAGNTVDWRVSWTPFGVGVLLDPLNVLMACVVSSIGLFVILFSVGYMRGEPSLTRYWFFTQLFIAGYVMLVMSGSLLLMFVGWEIVGVCCTCLAAFWYKDPHKARMGLKTYMILRVGDVLLLTSILIIYAYSGTLSLTDLQQSADWMLQLSRSGLLLITALMFFGGAVGKSAQFPLQGWLPDMLASSPSSFNALTECLAGPYIMARLLPIFHRALAMGCGELVSFFTTVAWMGAVSALLGALIAMPQRNVWNVLAYSISSVIGYMMTAFGLAGLMNDFVPGYLAGTFLLTVDAFVSGLLFLTAAFISYVVGSDDVVNMGGVKSKIAHRAVEVGVFAIINVPPLSGFWLSNWTQTLALDLAGEASRKGQQMLMISGYGLFSLLIITGAFTAIYGLRMMGYLFGERAHGSGGKRVEKVPRTMRISLVAMLVVTMIIDFTVPLTIPVFNNFFFPLVHRLFLKNVFEVLMYIIPSISTLLTILALAIGGYPAYQIYMKCKVAPAKLIEEHRFLKKAHGFLLNRCYIDAFYYRVANYAVALSRTIRNYMELKGFDAFNYAVARSFRRLSEVVYKYPELRGIDAFNYAVAVLFRRLSGVVYKYPELRGIDAFNYAVANFTTSFCRYFRKTHTGVLSYNMLAVFIGVALLIVILFLSGGPVP